MSRLAAALGVSALEFMHIETVLRIQRGGGFGAGRAHGAAATAARDRELDEAYRVLETTAGASDEEIAKAYRRQLQRHHPDKLKAHGLPESMMAHAKQRTQQIIEAWEIVRERRGIR
jgi:DnaJ like chaperone protein